MYYGFLKRKLLKSPKSAFSINHEWAKIVSVMSEVSFRYVLSSRETGLLLSKRLLPPEMLSQYLRGICLCTTFLELILR